MLGSSNTPVFVSLEGERIRDHVERGRVKCVCREDQASTRTALLACERTRYVIVGEYLLLFTRAMGLRRGRGERMSAKETELFADGIGGIERRGKSDEHGRTELRRSQRVEACCYPKRRLVREPTC